MSTKYTENMQIATICNAQQKVPVPCGTATADSATAHQPGTHFLFNIFRSVKIAKSHEYIGTIYSEYMNVECMKKLFAFATKD